MAVVAKAKKLKTVSSKFVSIPQAEYQAFLAWKQVKTFMPTPAQKKALVDARKNKKSGKYHTLYEFRKELGLDR